MRRSTRRITAEIFGWSPFWWGGKWVKRRMAKAVRRAVPQTCVGCAHYLGGGMCGVGLEDECAAGGYEAKEGST